MLRRTLATAATRCSAIARIVGTAAKMIGMPDQRHDQPLIGSQLGRVEFQYTLIASGRFRRNHARRKRPSFGNRWRILRRRPTAMEVPAQQQQQYCVPPLPPGSNPAPEAAELANPAGIRQAGNIRRTVERRATSHGHCPKICLFALQTAFLPKSWRLPSR